MDPIPRHQCFIYEGAPNRHLRTMSLVIRDKLAQKKRCVCLNSEPMLAGLRSYLAATGVDVEHEMRSSNLVLSSDRPHLIDGRFDSEGMLQALADEMDRALRDGYEGLWVTGDMTWELGPDLDVPKLVRYEQRLEEFFQTHPYIGGVCQYHANTLPTEVVQSAVRTQPGLFINETLSMLNLDYVTS